MSETAIGLVSQPQEITGLSNEELKQAVLAAVYEGQKGLSNLYMQEFEGRFCYDHSSATWYGFQEHAWKEEIVGEPIRAVTRIQRILKQVSEDLTYRISEIAAQIPSAGVLGDTNGVENIDTTDIADLKNKKKNLVSQKTTITKAQRNLDTLHYRKQITEFASTGDTSLGISGDEWDKDPWSLGCLNGIIDLKTGILRDGKPEDYIRSTCPTIYDTKATCPKFEKFLMEICSENHETVDFLQRFLGMGLIGDSRFKETLLILSGRGRNGKDTLCNVIIFVLGTALSGTIVPEMLMKNGKAMKASGSASSDIMDLQGKRILIASETSGGAGFDMAKVKFLSGGNPQKGRAPYGKREIQFPSSHVLILQTNDRPIADASDYAFWDRVKAVEFLLSYVDNPDIKTKPYERKKNPHLAAELEKESSGILNWLVKGYLAFQKEGLNEPERVKVATKSYRDEVDSLLPFIQSVCFESATERCRAGDLYARYQSWAIKNGLKPWNVNRFGRDMSKRYEKNPMRDATYYIGIGLRPIMGSDDKADAVIAGTDLNPDVREKLK